MCMQKRRVCNDSHLISIFKYDGTASHTPYKLTNKVFVESCKHIEFGSVGGGGMEYNI